ncbi:RimK/LysX family protein [Aliivibrio sp. S4TY2]|uniref:putative ATP-dependent zinc protease n=1 Tax=unclassified Aliivibrio TaxID=2645654 RepID=UPI0023789346|nr:MULTISPECIES: RimK/LysX family protein [unclassified Aliivibrio]MDD9156824.1 RimK/LysX family protein [Aliivibrio sp. S4TY2]MDD9160310.1 RimK/LysX family protein [Aliivibrio sp. S4TY1]MDD9164397.1 RimK/LysX family protein [Aliivibrio sp. S4MY2]MDD9168733.1 RimK/LysX family protein [Aliivibrio sp. S4MY4]MDD9184732.1 RimK/LysX family protein [Aliivibrio sp. S4MY3]
MKITKKWSTLLLPILLAGCMSTTATTTPGEATDKPAVEQPITPEKKPEIKPEQKPQVDPKPPVKKPVATNLKTADGKLILGEEEWMYIKAINHNAKARIDTGATTSSISAIDIEMFERDGKDWVKFKLAHNDKETKEFESPVVRIVTIRQSSTEERTDRPVIDAWVQIGDLKTKTEFTLNDRTHMTFPVLLGRTFFRDVAVVDVSKKFVQPKVKLAE